MIALGSDHGGYELKEIIKEHLQKRGIETRDFGCNGESCDYPDYGIAVGEAVAEKIEPIRQEKNSLLADKAYLDEVLKNGAERAERLAYRTLNKVYKKVGLVLRKRG